MAGADYASYPSIIFSYIDVNNQTIFNNGAAVHQLPA
jgi:hypothetical protein